MSERTTESIDLLSPEDFLMSEFRRIATNERGEPLTWGAPPLLYTSEVVVQQNWVKAQLSELFQGKNVPSYVSSNLAEYIEVLNISWTSNREEENRNSFAYRGKTDLEGLPLEALEVLDRAVKGSASPAELLLIAKVLQIPTIKLASLTDPYGKRMDQLFTMRSAVEDALYLIDPTIGNQVVDFPAKFVVLGGDNLHNPAEMEGLHMTRERTIAVLSDGTEIIEQSSFVLLVDALDSEDAQKIRAVKYGPNWSATVYNLGRLDLTVPAFLDNDQFDIASPISTTIEAVHPTLKKKLLSKDAMRERNLTYVRSRHDKA